MNILGVIKKVPGGMMIVPMFATALINTFFPDVLKLGGPTMLFTAKGTMVIIGLILFITGSQFRISQIGITLKRGAALCVAKIIIGFLSGWLILSYFGLDGFWGISAVALVSAMVSCNPGVYIALSEQYGDDADKAVFGLLNVIAVPATPILIIGMTSGTGLDLMQIVVVLIPFILGIILGNLDPQIRMLMAPATPVTLPFLGFCFGASVNLYSALNAGLAGIMLTIIYLLVNVLLMLFVDRAILRRPGYASVATCSVAGISVVVPSILAGSQPAFAPYVEAATSQLALVMVLTSFAVPWLTSRAVRLFGDGKPAQSEQ